MTLTAAQSHNANTQPAAVMLYGSDGVLINPAAPVLAASEAHVGAVGGHTAQVAVTPTIQAAAYSSGNVVGGIQTLANMFRTGGPGTGVLQSVLVIDRSNTKPPLTLLYFNANPAQGTYTDKAAFPSLVTNSNDAAKLIRKVNIAATDYETVGSVAIADITAIAKVLQVPSGTSLYLIPVVTGGVTFLTTTDITIRTGLLQD